MNKESFDAFLTSLDQDRLRAAEKYEQIRLRLINFFIWRGGQFPEDDADETINRIIRKLGEGNQIRDTATYVYGIARMVALEGGRRRELQVSLNDERVFAAPSESDESEGTELRLWCLDQCLDKLKAEARELITDYYRNEKSEKIEHRRRLAERLGIPVNALRIRALRTREKLSACIEGCLEKGT